MHATKPRRLFDPYLLGLALVLLSALFFSSAGLFVKGVTADSWTIIFWRGLFSALFTLTYIAYQRRIKVELFGMGKAGLAAAVVAGAGTVCFIAAFKNTSIANVAVIYAASPFIAAAIMWLWVREKPSTAVLIASVLAFFGVVIIVLGSLDKLNITGDILALLMTLFMSGFVCIYRRYPNTPAAGPMVVSSVLAGSVSLFMTWPFNVLLNELLILACFAVVFAVASVTLAEGARRLPAAQTSLISALETPIAPLWAWMLFGEVPAVLTLIGGAIIIAAVYGAQVYALNKARSTLQ